MTIDNVQKPQTAWIKRMNDMAKTAAAKKFELPFKNERKILIKQVCSLPDTFIEPPTHSKVLWWVNHGVRGNKLESHAEGGLIYTSVEAVHRFIERGNRRGE
jgi:hypothetical protein